MVAVNDAATTTSGVDFMDNGQTYTAGSKHEYFYDANGNISSPSESLEKDSEFLYVYDRTQNKLWMMN